MLFSGTGNETTTKNIIKRKIWNSMMAITKDDRQIMHHGKTVWFQSGKNYHLFFRFLGNLRAENKRIGCVQLTMLVTFAQKSVTDCA